jgi:CHAT domain-containing protein
MWGMQVGRNSDRSQENYSAIGRTLVHLSTHATFVVGIPDDSFILFGNGDRILMDS